MKKNNEKTIGKMSRKRHLKFSSFIGMIVFILVCVLMATSCKSDLKKSVSGVFVGDINVGKKSMEQIKEDISVLDGSFDNSSVEICVSDNNCRKEIKASDISLKFNIEKTAEKAFNYGKTEENKIKRNEEVDVGYEFDYDKDALELIIEEFSKTLGGDLKEHEINISGEYAVIKAGQKGKGINIDETKEIVIKSFKPSSKNEVEIEMKETEPKNLDVDYLYDYVKKDVQNAQYMKENGVIIVKNEIDGCEIDREDADEKLKGFGVGSDDIKIKLIITPAEVKKQTLLSKMYVDVLGQYSSTYAVSNKNRSANVERAGYNINGYTLLPGETFSYNTAVGPRTAERGFKVASVYEANRVADGMGGGICQTCSTLYPAVLYADLEIVERHNHSLEVSYVPLGMDATVAWNSLDFKFKNNTDYPVKIVCNVGKGNVFVKILGYKTDKSKSVKIITERTSYTPYTTKEIVDSTLAPGAKVSESNGFNGSSVNTYKVYYQNGKETKREKLGTSVYRMAEKVLRVGPAAPAVSAPLETSAPIVSEPPVQSPDTVQNNEKETNADSDVITPQEIQNEYPEGI